MVLIPLQWILICCIQLVAIVAGVFIIPVALLFTHIEPSSLKHSWADWKLERLPIWAWLWDNKRDGCLGDKRGNYWNKYPHPIMSTPFLKKYNWLAFRNPINNLSRYTPGLSCNLNKYHDTVKLVAGQYNKVENRKGKEGYQITSCKGLFPYLGIYYTSKWNIKGKHLCAVLGHKIHPTHRNIQTADLDSNWKGFTIRISFRKLK